MFSLVLVQFLNALTKLDFQLSWLAPGADECRHSSHIVDKNVLVAKS
jgi:hypothetical protein